MGTIDFFQDQFSTNGWLRYGVQVPNSQDLNLLFNHNDGPHQFTILSTVHCSAWRDDFESPDLIQSQLKEIGEQQNGMSLRAGGSAKPEQQWQNSLTSLASHQLQHLIASTFLDQSMLSADRLN